MITISATTIKEKSIMTVEDKAQYDKEVEDFNTRMKTELIKPMLAMDWEKADVVFRGEWRFLISPKIDGIRCIVKDGVAYTRTGKIHKNKYIQKRIQEMPRGYIFDGELMCGVIEKGKKFSGMTDGLTKIMGTPNFTFCIFDIISESPHHKRYTKLVELEEEYMLPPYCDVVQKKRVYSLEDVRRETAIFLEQGYEGSMLNEMDATYKHGRAGKTNKELIKIKEFSDAEAEIIGFNELEHNLNELTTDELGHSKRSTSKIGKIKGGVLGSFELRTPEGIEFNCAGFTDAEKLSFWNNRENLIGKWVKYKYFEIGADTKPRFPTFLSFREEGYDFNK